jgi:hypothetical protein
MDERRLDKRIQALTSFRGLPRSTRRVEYVQRSRKNIVANGESKYKSSLKTAALSRSLCKSPCVERINRRNRRISARAKQDIVRDFIRSNYLVSSQERRDIDRTVIYLDELIANQNN